jgi:PiT family inorganic phosphate transporter
LQWEAGLLPKVIIPMVTSPAAGFAVGMLLMFLLFVFLQRFTPHIVQGIFGKLQLVSAAWMAHSHGTNDAQKTMGIVALALFTGTSKGLFANLPPALHFLQTPEFKIPAWVVVLCAATMAAGTAAGGWRIIRTLGHKMVKLQPVHGFAAETTAALIIQVASSHGVPLSTTHVISASIMGVGAAKRFSGVKWGLVERIIWAWVLTLPFTALIGFILARAAAALS